MKMRHIINLFIILIFAIAALSACGGNSAEETMAEIPIVTPTPMPVPTVPPVPSPTPEPTPDLTGKNRSLLTGEWIDEEIAVRRPVAVVLNNRIIALPQSGIAQAAVVYEVLSEADITRLIAIFDDFNTERLGSVRSARDYFIDFALGHDALFVHHGASQTGYSALRRLNVDRVDGQTDYNAFWRDQKRVNAGLYEHSSYTSVERIFNEFEKKGTRLEIFEDYKLSWVFNPIEALPADGIPASKVTVPFSRNYAAVFDYNPDKKLYYKSMAANPHIDEETGEQINVTNVLIQITKMHVIAGDSEGRRNVTTVGAGKGYLATGGEYTEVTWKKESSKAPTQWFDAQGNLLRLNIGKTWVCVHGGDVNFE